MNKWIKKNASIYLFYSQLSPNQVEEKGGLVKSLFDIGYKRRLAAIEGSWFGARGLESMLWDLIVFKKIRTVLGGHIRFMLCGGAPLSSDTQRFINICMGYGSLVLRHVYIHFSCSCR